MVSSHHLRASGSEQRHSGVEFVTKNPDRPLHTLLACRCKSPQKGSAYTTTGRSKGEGDQNVGAAADPSIQDNLRPSVHRGGDCRESRDGCRHMIKLAAAMV
jgi:hypothetical protein